MTRIEALELELAARKLVEGTKLEWWEVVRQVLFSEQQVRHFEDEPRLDAPREDYELAVAIVEGRPVFVGDELYFKNCTLPLMVGSTRPNGEFVCSDGYWRSANGASWNPLAPEIPEGFTPWEGGEWVGRPSQRVKVLCRNRTSYVGIAGLMCWHNRGWPEDIIAYRRVEKYEEPETLMVELPLEIVEWFAASQGSKIGEACREALAKVSAVKSECRAEPH